ncbi:MAG: KTSC domain-containing protein [Acetatifactor sp.]|nr:KTSC domain-containing protein [Acetatifactor sp.]
MKRCKFASSTIASAGYDPIRTILEVEFVQGGEVLQYENVPEDIWYLFKDHFLPDAFFNKLIKGRYNERSIISIEHVI